MWRREGAKERAKELTRHITKAIKYEPAHFDNPINLILIFCRISTSDQMKPIKKKSNDFSSLSQLLILARVKTSFGYKFVFTWIKKRWKEGHWEQNRRLVFVNPISLQRNTIQSEKDLRSPHTRCSVLWWKRQCVVVVVVVVVDGPTSLTFHRQSIVYG